uniref:Uncharacterized protein n=1 Tax=Nelumbo nucifera TaxID=4432 RepID=A0A822XS08_NELNU|nr:TPA_asm: hypothetical protein HUJ06_025838 [Nelumbo nucifera]
MQEYMQKNKRKKPLNDFTVEDNRGAWEQIVFERGSNNQSDQPIEGVSISSGKSTPVSNCPLPPRRKENVRGPMNSFVRPSPKEVVEARHKGQLVQTSIESHLKKEERRKVHEYAAKWLSS